MARIAKAIVCVWLMGMMMMFTDKQLFAQPVPPKNNTWYLYNNSNTVFVFVHGIFSDSMGCWCSDTGTYWPALLCQDERFGNPSIYLGGYYTDFSSGIYRISNAADELLSDLRVSNSHGNLPPLSKDNIIFVAHSTGGLVVRYLLERYSSYFEKKNVGLVLLASPSHGSGWSNRLKWWRWSFKNRMVGELAPDSDFIRELNSRYADFIQQRRIPNLVGIDACENKFIVPGFIFNDVFVVSPTECASYYGAPRIIPDSTHFTIAKPKSISDPSHKLLYDFYETKFKPIEKVDSGVIVASSIPETIKCKEVECKEAEGDIHRPAWLFSGGVSYFQFKPNLPRDMIIHETHPDDRPFLNGSAGTTDLESVKSVFLDVSVEHAWPVSAGMDWGLQYSLKIPISAEGRFEKLNENEKRAATEGSYIYSKFEGMSIAHEAGINMTYHSRADSSINYTIKPSIYLGYWQMSFEKGWTRFGQDEPALVSDAKGFSLSPRIGVMVGNQKLSFSFNATYRFIDLKYDTDVLGSSTAQGWELGAAVVFGL